jgi:magnesium transporter
VQPELAGLGVSGQMVNAETALAYATKRIPTAEPDESVATIRAALHEDGPYDSMVDIAILDGERLIGMISIEGLFAANSDARAIEVMDPDPPVIAPGIDQETAAVQAVEHQESSLGVVDEEGVFLGLIPPRRMLTVLLDEHREDVARLGGYLHQSSTARAASEEVLARRYWHRLPWLLIGLLAAMLAAAIVAAFEGGLAAHLELVFFIPGIVYIAGAVGNQTVMLIVRGLSVGVSVSNVMVRELTTGTLLGTTLGLLAYAPVAFWFDPQVALAVSVSILTASALATGVAISLPWLLWRLGLDPAFGSGPLSTVIQDLTTLTVYFALASLVVL